jgi:hypothetical protein
MTMTTCADCGRPIFLRRPSATGDNRWAHQFGQAWIFTCRATWHASRLLAADYHHPASEEQRHFTAA